MPTNLKSEEHEDCLFLVLEGDFHVSELKRLIDKAALLAESTGNSRILADVTGLAVPISTSDRYEIGEYLARTFRGSLKAAVYGTEAMYTLLGETENLVELVTRNRGGNLRVFTNREAAEVWLLKD